MTYLYNCDFCGDTTANLKGVRGDDACEDCYKEAQEALGAVRGVFTPEVEKENA